jgi:hypothetical protein
MIGLSHMQLIVGIGEAYYNKPFPKYGVLPPPGWLTSIWALCSRLDLTLDIDDHWLPTTQRHAGRLLSDGALHQELL